MSAPVLLYVEVTSFYASVERSRDPELRGRAVIVGGDPRKRGLVQSASSEALESGVNEGMSMLDALGLCPRAISVKTNMKRYREASKALFTELRIAVDSLETQGLGAAFLDASAIAEDPEALAASLRDRVRENLGLPLRIGIAPVKFLARLAAEESGEEGIRRIRPGEEPAFLAPLPLSRLPTVGPKTQKQLAQLGATTVAELLSVRRERLEAALGNHGLRVREYARGLDSATVRGARHPQSLSQEATFEAPQLDPAAIRERIQRLAHALEDELRRQGLGGRRVAIRVRYDEGPPSTRSCTLEQPVTTGAEIDEAAGDLVERAEAGRRPIRGIGVIISRLTRGVPDSRQMDLFSQR